MKKFLNSLNPDGSTVPLEILAFLPALSNLLQTSIVVITSIPAAAFIPFVPTTLCSKMALLIAYNRSGPGHYDATQG